MEYTRREIGKLAIGLLPAGAVLARTRAVLGQTKPNSLVRGVQIAMNAPYNFDTSNRMSADDVLSRCVQLGVSAVELRSQPVEGFMAPALFMATAPVPKAESTPERLAAQKAGQSALAAWRLSAPMDQARAFRKKYEDAGVRIEVVKFDGIYARPDAEIDYCFNLAKNLGARAISCEIDRAQTKRLGQFADKHQLMVGYHGHAETTPAHWEEAFSQAKFNGANLDLGHFVAGNNTSPIPFLKTHHDRITHVHVKDRKMQNGPNVPFGEGDTPIVEALQLIRDNKWNIQATIEFEYPVPAGSDRMTEIAKCVDYCRKALV